MGRVVVSDVVAPRGAQHLVPRRTNVYLEHHTACTLRAVGRATREHRAKAVPGGGRRQTWASNPGPPLPVLHPTREVLERDTRDDRMGSHPCLGCEEGRRNDWPLSVTRWAHGTQSDLCPFQNREDCHDMDASSKDSGHFMACLGDVCVHRT